MSWTCRVVGCSTIQDLLLYCLLLLWFWINYYFLGFPVLYWALLQYRTPQYHTGTFSQYHRGTFSHKGLGLGRGVRYCNSTLYWGYGEESVEKTYSILEKVDCSHALRSEIVSLPSRPKQRALYFIL